MNFNKIFRAGTVLAAMILTGTILSSCEEKITIGSFDESGYTNVGDIYAYAKDVNNPRIKNVIDIYGESATAQLYFGLTKAADKAVDVTFAVDQAVLDTYNRVNGTTFEMYPAEFVDIQDGGKLVLAPGDKKSYPVKLTVRKNSAVVAGKTYAIPVATKVLTDGVKVKSDGNCVYFVTDKGQVPDPSKPSGIKTVIYFEVNDASPLNAGEYTLQSSGKPFADVVCIFAANINYDGNLARPYLSMNPNIKAILNNRDKYIKPLQDMGIKVTLSILGNHDIASVANLSDDSARDFAQQLKAIVDAYGLDGIEFDDEYSKPPTSNIPPAFVRAGARPFARLVYETKRIMPDKIVGVYHYGWAGFNFQVDGMDPGDFIDFTYEAFYADMNTSIWSSYRGMTKKQNSPYSRKINVTDYDLSDAALQIVRNEYGVQMLYNLNPKNTYVNSFNRIANVLYDDNIVFTGKTHDKDY